MMTVYFNRSYWIKTELQLTYQNGENSTETTDYAVIMIAHVNNFAHFHGENSTETTDYAVIMIAHVNNFAHFQAD